MREAWGGVNAQQGEQADPGRRKVGRRHCPTTVTRAYCVHGHRQMGRGGEHSLGAILTAAAQTLNYSTGNFVLATEAVSEAGLCKHAGRATQARIHFLEIILPQKASGHILQASRGI